MGVDEALATCWALERSFSCVNSPMFPESLGSLAAFSTILTFVRSDFAVIFHVPEELRPIVGSEATLCTQFVRCLLAIPHHPSPPPHQNWHRILIDARHPKTAIESENIKKGENKSSFTCASSSCCPYTLRLSHVTKIFLFHSRLKFSWSPSLSLSILLCFTDAN